MTKCPYCDGTGKVRVMAPVYPNEPHMADIDEQKCPECRGTGEADES